MDDMGLRPLDVNTRNSYYLKIYLKREQTKRNGVEKF